VEGNIDVGTLFERQVEEVGIQTSQYCLMRNDDNILLLALDLKDDRLQASDDVKVAFTARIAVSLYIHE
jgi:hypothetical protein